VKKINFAVIASLLAIAAVIGGSRLRAHAGAAATSGIPLSQLAGSFAVQSASNYGICFNKNFTAVQSCSITPTAQVVSWLDSGTSQQTTDTAGNSCGEEIEANAPLFPGPQALMTIYSPALPLLTTRLLPPAMPLSKYTSRSLG
jgi:hypothetical protein